MPAESPRKPGSGEYRAVPGDPSLKPDSGMFRAVSPSPEELALQGVVRSMFLAQDAAAILGILSDETLRLTHAAGIAAFVYGPDRSTLTGGDPALLPEAAVIDYVFQAEKPATVPNADGRFITVLPMRVGQDRVGVLVLDVTAMGEDAANMDLELVSVMADQAAVALNNVQLVSRSIGESTLLSNILDSITNAIVTLDPQGAITRLNRNAMAMLELSADAVGRPYGQVFLPDVTQAVDVLLQEIRHLGFAMEKMVTAKLAQGLELNIAIACSILRDESRATLGTIVVFRDMTASRELERLRKLDTMKSEFVANVSHELKTPLTSIKAYTEALLDMAQDEQMKNFLKVIDEESDRLLSLINDLLNVSRIQSGKMKMRFEPVAPRTIVDEIVKISKVNSPKHELILQLADDLPRTLLDKEKMKEVIINLISNAIKYSPKGGKVWVRMGHDASNLMIEVQDEGMGITPENQAKVFQAFYRVDASHTAEIAGTGLGLVICKAIVEHHGGRIWLASEFGKGTTFFILIPLRKEIRRDEVGGQMGSMAEGA
ncbi:MAG TPA: ATP-binding protein [Planctomycetota bacterium]|nr:ATP-binding protein [Planctomycetota bacterium]